MSQNIVETATTYVYLEFIGGVIFLLFVWAVSFLFVMAIISYYFYSIQDNIIIDILIPLIAVFTASIGVFFLLKHPDFTAVREFPKNREYLVARKVIEIKKEQEKKEVEEKQKQEIIERSKQIQEEIKPEQIEPKQSTLKYV